MTRSLSIGESFTSRRAKVAHARLPCVSDPDSWFVSDTESERTAVERCRACPLVGPCLDFALSNDRRHGVWGAATPAERELLRKQSR